MNKVQWRACTMHTMRRIIPEPGNLVLYANQAGIAMGIMAEKIPIRECHAVRISENGLRIMNEKGVAVTYEGQSPL